MVSAVSCLNVCAIRERASAACQETVDKLAAGSAAPHHLHIGIKRTHETGAPESLSGLHLKEFKTVSVRSPGSN